LSFHRTDTGTLARVDEGNWDVVVLQELSTRPTDNAGNPGLFKADATWFYDRIKMSSPNARVILYETWARHPNHSIYTNTFTDAAEMQAQLRLHYNDAANNYIPANATSTPPIEVGLAPVGDVWEVHLNGMNPLRLHDTDDYHAGANGRYLNALVIYATIYGRATIHRTPWPPNVNDATTLQQEVDTFTGVTMPGGPNGEPVPDDGLDPGDVVLIDCGGGTTATGWNNMTDSVAGQLSDAVNTDGDTSNVDMSVSNGFVGHNTSGIAANMVGFPGTATGDSFFTGSFNDHAEALTRPAQLTISDLEPMSTYTVRIFASRTNDDGGRLRETLYEINGASQVLDASDNVSQFATFTNVQPSMRGDVVIDVSVNTNGTTRFAYVGVVELTKN